MSVLCEIVTSTSNWENPCVWTCSRALRDSRMLPIDSAQNSDINKIFSGLIYLILCFFLYFTLCQWPWPSTLRGSAMSPIDQDRWVLPGDQFLGQSEHENMSRTTVVLVKKNLLYGSGIYRFGAGARDLSMPIVYFTGCHDESFRIRLIGDVFISLEFIHQVPKVVESYRTEAKFPIACELA